MGSSRRTECALLADRATPVGRRDGVCLTLREESGIGLTVVAHDNCAMAEMNHLDDVRVTRRRDWMVVIPPMYRCGRARFDESRTLLCRTPWHGPSPPLHC